MKYHLVTYDWPYAFDGSISILDLSQREDLMTFDSDLAAQTLKEFEQFMRRHAETERSLLSI